MKYTFDILRRKDKDSKPYHQRIEFVTENDKETVATALIQINNGGNYKDADGNIVEEITWEAGCLQKKCGACAMLINGLPQLACDTFLNKLKKSKVITLAPLSKFPVIKDLVVDRSVMYQNLKTLRVWSGESAEIKECNLDEAYDAARCLQCGCCLEACPNFCPDGDFMGAAGFAPQARLISTYLDEEQRAIRKLYSQHVYEGCGKSLACAKVCPAEIDLDRLASRSNAIAIWHRK